MRLSQPTLKIGPTEPAPRPEPPPRRKRRWLLAVAPLVLLALAAGAWRLWAPPRVLHAQGTLVVRRFEATPRGQARVLWRAGAAGTSVEAGERVLEVERIGPEVKLAPAAPGTIPSERERLVARAASARAELVSARVRERISREALARVETLFARGGATLPEVERAREELARARADMKVAQARSNEAQLVATAPPAPPPPAPPAEREVFYAPFPATITLAPVPEGEVTAPLEPALVLVERQPTEVEGLVEAAQVGRLRPGGSAVVELPGARSGARHLGVITVIGGPPREPPPAGRGAPAQPLVPVRVRLTSPLAPEDGVADGRPIRLRLQVERR